uniref:Uncharacterized protein n=1 Tax=Timema cristinae TaxID=61476 RepID=A0A7R9H7U7_TIMCR|nr:unnamed protein product [Timema cristinae]
MTLTHIILWRIMDQFGEPLLRLSPLFTTRVTVDPHVHQKTSAEQKRGHVASSKPITRFPPHWRELFC